MPRAISSKFPSVEHGQLQEAEMESSFEEEDVQSESVVYPPMEDFLLEVDAETVDEAIGSGVVHRLKKVSDQVITFLGSACMDRMTDAGVQRMISCQTDSIREQVMEIWKSGTSEICCHIVCNQCGDELVNRESCCGELIKYYRVGGVSQLEDVVEQHLDEILKVRQKLRNGTDENHNLNGEFLKGFWQSEEGKILKISLIGSVDGVALNGNTSLKIWPVTFMIVDLPTGEMQRAHNIVVHGIAEGPANPSTSFWNRVIEMAYSDIEHSFTEIRGLSVCFSICTWTADQPAKRSLFGMKHFNSENSCFFGMCRGTLYKTMGPKRSEIRANEKTDQDALNGLNGFGPTYPKILDYVYPYDTIIDILHNASEGIYPIIIKEVIGNCRSRSELFKNDSRLHSELCEEVMLPPEFDPQTMSNCSEKLTYFRAKFGMGALMNPTLKPEARLVISSLMLLLNGLYTNAPSRANNFFTSLTAAPRWALSNASEAYMATKTHELLSHLPDVISKFGNVAPLSTFSFEHYYKHCLKGFSPQKTKGFTQSAIARVILHSAVRREILLRSEKSFAMINFLKATPSWMGSETSWKEKIGILDVNHRLPQIADLEFFAKLKLSIGTLQSRYSNPQTKRDVFFASDSVGAHACYKFVCFCSSDNQQLILAERIRPLPVDEQFPMLQDMMNSMTMPGNTYSFHVFTQFKRYDGIVHGKETGELELLDINVIKGIGGAMKASAVSSYFLQLNGACVHH